MGLIEFKIFFVFLDGCFFVFIVFFGVIVCKSFIKIEINIKGYDVN